MELFEMFLKVLAAIACLTIILGVAYWAVTRCRHEYEIIKKGTILYSDNTLAYHWVLLKCKKCGRVKQVKYCK